MRIKWQYHVKLWIKYLVQSNCLVFFFVVVMRKRWTRREKRRRRRPPLPTGDTVNIYWINKSLDSLRAAYPRSALVLPVTSPWTTWVSAFLVCYVGRRVPFLVSVVSLGFYFYFLFLKQNYTCKCFKEKVVLRHFFKSANSNTFNPSWISYSAEATNFNSLSCFFGHLPSYL